MRIVKYTVYLPISKNEIKTIIFYSLKEVCEFLNINSTTVYNIINETCLFSTKNLQHLKGIKIIKEKIEDEKKNELKEKILGKKRKVKKDENIVYQTELLEKYNEKVKKGEILL
jgi:hypothetical protein